MPTTLDLPDELSFDEAQKFSAPAAAPPPQPQSLPDEMSFDEFTKLAKPEPTKPSLPDEMSFEDYSKIAKPEVVAQPPAPPKTYQYKIFGGKYPQPGFIKPDEEGGGVTPDYGTRAARLPASKSELKDGQWYNITDPKDGALMPHIWVADKNAFFDLPTAQTNPNIPERPTPKSKYEITPKPGLTWSGALNREWAAGNQEAGSLDAALTADPGSLKPKGFQPLESPFENDPVNQRLAIEGTKADDARRWFEENFAGYKDNALVRSVVTGLAQAGSTMVATEEKLNPWGSKELGNAMNRQAGAAGQAGQYEAQTNPSMLSPEMQQQLTGAVGFTAKLGASGGSFPLFALQSAAEAATGADTKATDSGLTGTSKTAYVVGHTAADVLTNLLFMKLGAPQASLSGEVGAALSESLRAAGPAIFGGTVAQMIGDVASRAQDALTGIDPTALSGPKLEDAMHNALLTQFLFAGLSHLAEPALRDIAQSSGWKAIKDATGARIGDAGLRAKVSEAAKSVLEQTAPEAKPEAVATEQPKPPEVQPTEVPNAPQQVDVVRPDNQGAPQGSEVPQDQGQVRGQEGQRPGGGDSVPGQGQEVVQPVPPETKVKPGGFGRLLKELPRDDVHQLLTDSGAELTNDDRLIWRDKRDFGQKIGGSRKAVVEWLLGRVKGDDPATYAPNDPEWMGLLKRAREIITGVKAPAAPVVEGGGPEVAPQQSVDAVNRAYGFNLKPTEPTAPHDQEIQQFLRDRGVDPTYVDAGKSGFTGMTHKGNVVLAAGLEANDAWGKAIHELAHQSDFDKGSPYQERLITEAAQRYLEKAHPEYAKKVRSDPALLRQEGIATLAGEIWSNPSAREQLEAKSPGLLQKVKDFLLKIVGAYTPEDKAARATVDWLRKTVKEAPSTTLEGALLAPLSETTAAKNASMEEDRRILGLTDLPPAERHAWEVAQSEASQQKIADNAMSIAAETLKSGRQMSDTEAAGLTERANAIKNEHDFLSERIAKLTDMGDIKSAAADLSRLGNEFDVISEAIRKSGTKTAQALAIRKMPIDRDFNILSVKARAKAAKGEALSPKEDLELTGATQRLKKVVDQQEEAQQKLKNIQEDKKTAATKDVQKQVEDLQKKVDEAPLPEDLNKLAQKLARHFIEAGVDGRENVVDAVHNELKQALPDLSRSQTARAIAGYGDFKQLSMDEASVKLRGYKGELQQLAKLEDMAAGIAPAKTGIERRTPTDVERGLIKQVAEKKKEGGYVVTDPERQLKTAIDAINTRLKNQIKDLSSQIESRTKIVKDKRAPPRDAETERLIAERDRLKEQFDSIFGKPELTDEQRIQMAKRAVEKNIKDYERRLKEGDFSPRNAPSKTPNTPELEALRAQREQLAAKYKEANPNPPELQRAKDKLAQLQEHLAQGTLPEPAVRGKPNPKTEKIQAQIDDLRQQLRDSEPAQKQRLEKSIARLEARLKEFTWWNQPKAKEPKEDKPLMTELESLDYKANLLRQQIQAKIAKLKPRSIGQKISDMAIWWRRLGVLSSPVSLVKLGSAAAEGMTFEPAKEAVGAGILKMFPSLAARTRAESASSLRIEANALAKAFTQLATDVGRNIKSGTTDYELKYGGKEPLPEEMVNFFARLHGATKSPLKRQTFERSFAKIAQQYGKAGANLDDPMVQMQIGTHAYAEANRALFMESNVVTDFINRGLQSTTEPNKDTGEPTKAGLALRTTVKLALPIMRIPTNLVSRTFQAALGLPVGAARLTAAFARGIDTLPPAQADSIMRQLKAGSIGAAFLLYGYYNRANIGGYYQPGQKRDEKDVKADQTRLFGVDFPAWTQHHPFFMVMQLGATVGRVADSFRRKADTEPRGLRQGVEGAVMGAAEQAPIVRETFDLQKLQDPNQRDKFLQDYAESLIVPLGVQWLYKKIVPKDTSADDAKALKQMERDLKTMSQNLDLSKENSRKRLEAAQKRMSK